MDYRRFTVCALFFLGLITEAFLIPVDVGACSPKRITCECGRRDGYNVHIYIRQCSKFHRWRLKCGNCKDEPDNDSRCSVFRHCLDCDDTRDECSSCPVGRYGKRCTAECKCPRGVACDRDSGRCTCGNDGCQEPQRGCPIPQFVENGGFIPVKSSYQKGSSVTYLCNSGFKLQGPTTIYCVDNGQWVGQVPTCVSASTCPVTFAPTNGFVDHDLQNGIAIYQCDVGFNLVGDTTRTCGPNSTWFGSTPKCEKIIRCEIPSEPEDGFVVILKGNVDSLIPGDKVRFSCQENFSMIGQETLVCSDDGSWSHQPPQCVHRDFTCSDPGPLLNGNVTVVEARGQSSIYLIGTQLKFCCQPLHYLYGNETITCTENNTWTGQVPVCIKVITCPALEKLASGYADIFMPDPDSENSFKVATLPSNVSSRAVMGVKFRSAQPTLSPRARAATLSVKLPNGHYHVGTRASFNCESRYFDFVGSKVRSCLTTGQWSGRPPSCIPVCGRSSVPRAPLITRGTVSAAGQWPWQVGVSRRLEENDPLGDWFLMCGASLINEHWVVTAAHCVTYSQSNLVVPLDEFRLYFGKFYRNDTQDDSEVQMRLVEEIHVHPDYEPTSFESDIALLKISTGVTLTSRVQPVCLPSAKDGESDIRLGNGNEGTVTGWGMKEDGSFSDVLQHTKVPVVSSAQCQQDYRDQKVPIVVSTNMICAGFATGGFDSCSGDSGGPLVFPKDSREDRWVLEGIVSWGSPFGCGQEKQYGGYARVERFVEWMEHFI